MFRFFNCFQIPQINWNIKSFPFSLQCIKLLVKIMLVIAKKRFLHANKCIYTALNVGIELHNWEGNWNVFLCSFSNTDLLWNCSSSVGEKTLVNRKMLFLYIHSVWNKKNILNLLFKVCYWVLWYTQLLVCNN